VARHRLQGRAVTFEQGDIDHLAGAFAGVDAIFFCNAIHLIPNKDEVVGKIARTLGPRGYFACNSSFFDGAYAPGSERFYHLWTRRALGWLRKQHPDIRLSRNGKTTAMQWLSPDEYAAVLAENGLRVVERDLEQAHLPLRSWQDIGHYWLFIEGALPGVPIPVGADALEHAAGEAFAELGIHDVPRIWLQLIARKDAD
jgi:SAM-dependent methyltransferase